MIDIGTITALLSILVTIELAQLGVLASTWQRSRANQRRLRSLLRALGVGPGEGPMFDIEDTVTLMRDRGESGPEE